MVRVQPKAEGHDPFERLFHFQRRLAGGELSPVGDTENVRIDGNRRLAEYHVQHDVGRLSSYSGQRLERFAAGGHFSAMALDQSLGQSDDIFGFGAIKPDRLDVFPQPLFPEPQHFGRCVRHWE